MLVCSQVCCLLFLASPVCHSLQIVAFGAAVAQSNLDIDVQVGTRLCAWLPFSASALLPSCAGI